MKDWSLADLGKGLFQALKGERPEERLQASRAGDLRAAVSGNIFVTLFGAVALVGAVGATATTIIRGPMTTMAEVSQRAFAERQVMANAKLAIVSVSQPSLLADANCDKDGTVEPIPWDAGAGPSGGGLFPAAVPSSGIVDPWTTTYGYCVWDHGTLVDDVACGGVGQNRLPGLNTTTYPAGNVGIQTTIAVVSAGPDRTFQTICNDWATADANADGDLADAGDKPLAETPSGSDDIVLTYNYAEAEIATSSNWKIQSGGTSVAEMTQDKVEVTGDVEVSGAVNVTGGGLLLASDPGDDSVSGACNAANDKVLRKNTSASPAALEICDDTGGNGWVAISGGGGGSGFDWATAEQEEGTASDNAAGDQLGFAVAVSGNYVVVGAPYDDDNGSASGAAYVYDVNGGDAELRKLTPADGAADDNFGASVAVYGKIAVIGAPLDDDNGSASGSAYVFNVSTGAELFKLTPADGAADDNFGAAVALYSNYAVIGAALDDDNGSASGAAYVFNSATGAELNKLTPADGAAGDEFGDSVAVSGNYAVIGAYLDDDNGSASGAAYVFNVTTGAELNKLTPADGAADDNFGASVSVSGNYAVIGAPLDDDDGSASGSAYVFNADTGAELDKLTAGDAAAGDEFGTSVAVSGGSAVVSAHLDDDNGAASGAAYVFDISTGSEDLKMLPHEGAAGDNFGAAVAIAGDYAVIGVPLKNETGASSGGFYVFGPLLSEWASAAELEIFASDGAASDSFGDAVGISGDYVVVGAAADDDNGNASGTAFVYDTMSGSELQKLTPADGAADDRFGEALGLDGIYSVVGAPGDDDNGAESGSAYVFNVTTGAELFKLTPADGAAGDNFGAAVAVYGSFAVIGADLDDGIGSAYVFDVTTGAEIRKLTPADGAAGDLFGGAVALYDDFAVIGAPGDDDNGAGSGSAYVFDITTGAEVRKITASDGAGSDAFGLAVTLYDNYAVIGAPLDDDDGSESGAAYLFDITDGSELAKLIAAGAAAGDEFGTAVSIFEDVIAVGADKQDASGTDTGAVYIFNLYDYVQDSKIVASERLAGDNFGTSISLGMNGLVVGANGDDDLAPGAGAAYIYLNTTLTASIGIAYSEDFTSEQTVLQADSAESTARTFGTIIQSGNLAPGFETGIGFRVDTTLADDEAVTAAITAQRTNTDKGGGLAFKTQSSTGNLSPRMFLDEDGDLGLSTYMPYDVLASLQVGAHPLGQWSNISDGLIGHWKLNETAGTSVADSAGTATGTWTGSGAVVSVAGQVGTAFDFDGASEYVDLGTGTDLKPGFPLSVAMWVNFDSAGESYFFGNDGHAINFQSGFWLYKNSSDNISANFGDAIPNVYQACSSSRRKRKDGTTALNTGQWYHVTVAFQDTQDITIYIDGVDDGGSYSGLAKYVDYLNDTATIGKFYTCGSNRYFDGKMDDIRLYDRALSAGDVADIMAATVSQLNDFTRGALFTNDGKVIDWTQVQELEITASDGAGNDQYGVETAIEGDYALIGAYFDDDNGVESGTVFVHDVSNGTQLRKLNPTDADVGDVFGTSVDLSGTTAIIGAVGDDDNGSASGSAYLMDVTTGNQLFKLIASDGAADDDFGRAVAISGNYALVGAPLDDDNGADSGAAFVYDVSTGAELFKLTPSDAAADQRFGVNVDLDGTTAVIGAIGDAGFAGAAYVFNVSDGGEIVKLIPADVAAGDLAGASVAISGDRVLVGSYQDDDNGTESGSAYVFSAAAGTELFKLTPADGAADDKFGRTVSFSNGYTVIGAPGDDDNGAESGSAYTFDISTGAELHKFTASDGAAGDNFADNVTIDGNVILIGAYLDDEAAADSGSAYLFTAPDPQAVAYFGMEGQDDSSAVIVHSGALKIQDAATDGATTTEIMRVDTSGNTTFYQNTVDVAASAQSVGGTSSSDTAGTATSVLLNRYRGTSSAATAIANGDLAGALTFGGYDGSAMDADGQAAIYAKVNGAVAAGSVPVDLHFSADAAGTATASSDMVLTDAGNLGIGVAAPEAPIHVNDRILFDAGLRIGADANCSYSDTGTIRTSGDIYEYCNGADWTPLIDPSATTNPTLHVPFAWGLDTNGRQGNSTYAGNQDAPGGVTNIPFVQVDSGDNFMCGVTAQGLAYCWGNDTNGKLGNGAAVTTDQSEPSLVTTVTNFSQVSAGSSHACGVATDGKAYCWGDDSSDQLGDGAGATDQPDPVQVLNITNFTQVSAGQGSHSCGVTAAGTVYCWGGDASGELGNGAGAASDVPDQVSGITTATHVEAGNGYSCALLSGGTVECWGDGTRLGQGSTTNQTAPVSVLHVNNFSQISVGPNHSCGTTSRGLAYCWGLGASDKIGDGLGVNVTVPSRVLSISNFSQIETGTTHSCGFTTEGKAWCWGDDTSGGLGDGGPDANQSTPVAVSTGYSFSDISLGNQSSIALAANDTQKLSPVFAWGRDNNNQLGNDVPATDIAAPNMVYGQYHFMKVDGGTAHSCGIADNGDAYCWGQCDDGRCGDNDTSAHDNDQPVLVDGSHKWIDISAGDTHSCGVTENNLAYCWGDDTFLQIGNGATTGDQGVPVLVSGDLLWTQISAGPQHSCGLSTGGDAWCWGENSDSRLGDAGTTDQDTPVLVSGGIAWSTVAAGPAHSCGLSAEGIPYCWGDDTNKSLGNGAAEGSKNAPFAVTGAHNFRRLTVSDTVCGIDFSGDLYCWGSNSNGEAGIGNTTAQEDPVLVNVAWVWQDVALSTTHGCGLDSAGTGYCWGDDTYGQMGNGAAGASNTPDAIDTVYQFETVTAGTHHSLGILEGGTLDDVAARVNCPASSLTFTDIDNADLSTLYTTEEITLRGLTGACTLTLASESTSSYIEKYNTVTTNWDNVGSFTDVRSGDQIRIKITSAAAYETETNTYLTIGDARKNIVVETWGKKLVFATSTTHSGDLDGVAGANTICQVTAQNGNLPGLYAAWITDSDAGHDPVDLFAQSPHEYILPDGTKVADSWADLTDGSLDAAINMDESGAALAAADAWTNTGTNGAQKGAVNSCSDWSDGTAGANGEYGNVDASDATWSDDTTATCDNVKHLYCFQQ